MYISEFSMCMLSVKNMWIDLCLKYDQFGPIGHDRVAINQILAHAHQHVVIEYSSSCEWLALWLWLGTIDLVMISLCVVEKFLISFQFFLWITIIYICKVCCFHISYLGLSGARYWHVFIIYRWVVVALGSRCTDWEEVGDVGLCVLCVCVCVASLLFFWLL